MGLAELILTPDLNLNSNLNSNIGNTKRKVQQQYSNKLPVSQNNSKLSTMNIDSKDSKNREQMTGILQAQRDRYKERLAEVKN
jgi:hypothetical protein